MTLLGYFWDRWPSLAGKLFRDVTTTQVNSALHPCGVAKSSTSFGWGKGGKVTAAGWQVTLCDLIWHVISCSGVVISITNSYIRVYFALLYLSLFLIVHFFKWDTLLSTTLADTSAWGRHTYEAEVFISDCVYYSSKWLNKVRKTIRFFQNAILLFFTMLSTSYSR